ncbi:MAG: DUF4388 domain-containing protein [Thermodesulfobacteriota bacterium]
MSIDKDRILIALKDTNEAEKLSGHLSRTGFDVAVAPDGALALEAAIGLPPALVMVDPDLPVIGGEMIFQILRNNPHTSGTPFLFISDAVADIKNFRTGVDAFLVRPLNVAELLDRVVRTITARQARGDEVREMEGKLSNISVADILQFLQLNRKQGELIIDSGPARGVVYLKGGNPYNATVEGAEGYKALYRLLGWTEGRFEFIPKGVSVTRKIRTGAEGAIMEGLRQLDEFKKKKSSLPAPETIVEPQVPASRLPRDLPPAAREAFALVGGRATVADVVAGSRRTDYEAYQALATLISKGLVAPAKPGRARAAGAGELLTRDQAIGLREKIISRFADSPEANFARIMVLATSGPLVASFMDSCAMIKGFKVAPRPAPGRAQAATAALVGEIAELTLYGGMDLVVFAVPTPVGMGPIWNAFSTRLAGLVLLWDKEGTGELARLAEAKREIALQTGSPVAHVYMGAGPGDKEEAAFRKALNIRSNEEVFHSRPAGAGKAEGEGVSEALYSIFARLLKEGRATA